MDDLVAYGSYPNSKQGDITLKSVQDMVAHMNEYGREMHLSWSELTPDFKLKEKKKEW